MKHKKGLMVLCVSLLVGILSACAPTAQESQTALPAAVTEIAAAVTEAPVVASATTAPTAAPTATETATAAETARSLTWNNGISQLFTSTCGSCHSGGRMNLTTYASVVQRSREILRVQQGRHKGTFSSADLSEIVDWLNAGAPEN